MENCKEKVKFYAYKKTGAIPSLPKNSFKKYLILVTIKPIDFFFTMTMRRKKKLFSYHFWFSSNV